MRSSASIALLLLAASGCEEPTSGERLCQVTVGLAGTLDLSVGESRTLQADIATGDPECAAFVGPLRIGWSTTTPGVVLFEATTDSSAVVRAVGPGEGFVFVQARGTRGSVIGALVVEVPR